MSAAKIIKEILKERRTTITDFAWMLKMPEQTLRNKLHRDTMSFECVKSYIDILDCDLKMIDRKTSLIYDSQEESGEVVRQSVAVSVPVDMLADLQSESKADGLTISDYICELLGYGRQYRDKERKKTKVAEYWENLEKKKAEKEERKKGEGDLIDGQGETTEGQGEES